MSWFLRVGFGHIGVLKGRDLDALNTGKLTEMVPRDPAAPDHANSNHEITFL